MKILLIAPAMDVDREFPEYLTLPPLSLYLLKGLTPEEHEVVIQEETFGPIDFAMDCDLVGITCMTPSVTRAYEIADEFRRRHKTVIMGGIHTTALPDEALQHADSVLVGEAENIWEEILKDFEAGNLKKKYNTPMPELNRYIPIDSSLVRKRKGIKLHATETSRGCPYDCNFCCVPEFYGRHMRQRPYENIIKDIEHAGGKFFIFLDDNILGKPSYAREFFKHITPLKIKWIGQCSLATIERHPDLLDAMAKSGCQALLFGVESVSNNPENGLKKSLKSKKVLEDLIYRISNAGIHFHSSIIFGFDTDTESVFDDTLEFLQRTKIATSSICLMTPYPGTVLYNNMLEAGRLITTDWRYYTGEMVVFKPTLMTPERLHEGFIYVKREFSRFGNALKRYPQNWRHPFLHFLGNHAYHSEIPYHHKQWASFKEKYIRD